jgi:DNA-binding LacI/PurR family transcriptional regulator
MATIRDVAKAAGVSTATVSYVLNDSFPVSEATRQRVLEAVERLGYHPNITARNLRASESRMIGYAWHGGPYSGEIQPILDCFIHHIAAAAEVHGYHVLTFTHNADNALDVYADLIEIGRVDAFVIASTNVDDERIRFLMEVGFPFVAFGRANPDWDFPYVDVDGESGMRAATEYLLELGHRRIALIGWPQGSMAGDSRYAGYCAALKAANLVVDSRLVMRGEESAATGRQVIYALLTLPPDERPTAIVAVSDLLAIGAMSAIEQLGMTVGDDVAVIGFDNVPLADYLHPPLTSLHQPIDLVAQTLIDMLMALLDGAPLLERHVLVQPELIVRASSGGPR